ncbi:MAG: UbiX family flavin prenyltransferase [archaeon]|nr:UbiX family flavin prenyltransferase [archaeon]
MKTVVAMTGASGALYGIRLLQMLPGEKILVMSKTAREIIPAETTYSVEEVEAMADVVYNDDDMFAAIASGSFYYDSLFVVPCTASSVAKFACGIADTLISRTFACALKEQRKIVLVVRETPKSAIMLENELKLARLGVVIMDANPGFYPKPQTVSEIVDFIVGRCLMQAGIEQKLFPAWGR